MSLTPHTHMNSSTPPPLPGAQRTPLNRSVRLLIGLAVAATVLFVALLVLRIGHLVMWFNVPTGAMSPAISPGDHVLMQGISYLGGGPHRGDVVVFKTDGTGPLPSGRFYVMRVAGEPGDQLRILDGRLYINNQQVTLSNAAGAIAFFPPQGRDATAPPFEATVPPAHYFVLGDNSTNSLDSRYWGSLPRNNVIGRMGFCYWPPRRIGWVK